MILNEIKGTYDVIFSLGHNCLAADQLSRTLLRKVGGVIDWVETPRFGRCKQSIAKSVRPFHEIS